MTILRALCVLGLAICGWLLYVLIIMTFPVSVLAACERYTPNPPHEPTGIKGCAVYGEGVASQWPGPGVARNDCVYPWTGCEPIRITSLETGRSVERTPSMYCDCYTGTADERIVDLDPPTLAALGLDPARGLHRVRVEPLTILPNTSAAP